MTRQTTHNKYEEIHQKLVKELDKLQDFLNTIGDLRFSSEYSDVKKYLKEIRSNLSHLHSSIMYEEFTDVEAAYRYVEFLLEVIRVLNESLELYRRFPKKEVERVVKDKGYGLILYRGSGIYFGSSELYEVLIVIDEQLELNGVKIPYFIEFHILPCRWIIEYLSKILYRVSTSIREFSFVKDIFPKGYTPAWSDKEENMVSVFRDVMEMLYRILYSEKPRYSDLKKLGKLLTNTYSETINMYVLWPFMDRRYHVYYDMKKAIDELEKASIWETVYEKVKPISRVGESGWYISSLSKPDKIVIANVKEPKVIVIDTVEFKLYQADERYYENYPTPDTFFIYIVDLEKLCMEGEHVIFNQWAVSKALFELHDELVKYCLDWNHEKCIETIDKVMLCFALFM